MKNTKYSIKFLGGVIDVWRSIMNKPKYLHKPKQSSVVGIMKYNMRKEDEGK